MFPYNEKQFGMSRLLFLLKLILTYFFLINSTARSQTEVAEPLCWVGLSYGTGRLIHLTLYHGFRNYSQNNVPMFYVQVVIIPFILFFRCNLATYIRNTLWLL